MSHIQEINNKIFKNASWLLGDKTASSIFGALQTIIVARMLGVKDYGLLVLVVTYIDLLVQFFDLRVWETATKYIGTFWEEGDRDKTGSMIKLSYLMDVSSGVVAFIIAILTAKIISTRIIHSPDAYIYVWIYSFSLFIRTANSTSIAILRVFDKFKQIAFIRSFQSFLRFATITTLLLLGYGIKGVLIGYVLTGFVGFFIRIWVVLGTLGEKGLSDWWRAKISLISDHYRSIAWFVGNTSFASTVRMGEERFLGTMILGYFAGKEAVAFYNVGSAAAKLASYIVDPLYEAIYPELVKIKANHSVDDIKKVVIDTTKKLSMILIPVAVIMIIFAELIIHLVFGTAYLPAVNALRIIALAVVVARITFWINPVLLALEKPGLRTILGIISTSFYLLLLFILVPEHSYIGAAFAFLGFAIVKSSLSVYMAHRLFRS